MHARENNKKKKDTPAEDYTAVERGLDVRSETARHSAQNFKERTFFLVPEYYFLFSSRHTLALLGSLVSNA